MISCVYDDTPDVVDAGGFYVFSALRTAITDAGNDAGKYTFDGLDAAGTLVFRQISQFTRGKFIFIEYGDAATSAASHGVKGKVESNNLDDIIYEQVRDELAVWGRAM